MGESGTQSEAVVRRFFDLLNAEDLEGIGALLSEDAAWVPEARRHARGGRIPRPQRDRG